MSRARAHVLPAGVRLALSLCCLCHVRSTVLAQSSPSPLLLPIAVAYDAGGDLFFVDGKRNQVFELTLAGTWSVVAGTGQQGFAGDGGPAVAALLSTPRGLAVGADGTVYIADTGNQRIRAIRNGAITTVAGSGVRGFSGDGPVLQTALRDPTGLALDAAGNLLLCDTGNQRVRRVSGGNLATVAGSGVQGYSGDGGAAAAAELDTPLSVAGLASGAILVADTHNQRVRMIAADGTLTTFAGTGRKGFSGDGGPAASAALNLPYGVAVAADGSVLIADAGNQRIRVVSSQGTISTVAGSGIQGMAPDATAGATAALNNPRAVGLQAQGQPVLADAGNGLVRELADDNALYTLALLAAPRSSRVTLTAANTVYGAASVIASVSGGAASPQGSVLLLDSSGATLGGAQLASGQATFPLAQLEAGPHTLTATYAGDGLNGAAVSGAAAVTVSQAPSTTALQPVAQTYAGLPVLLTASVASGTAGTPSGTVDFLDGTGVIASSAIGNGSASATFLNPSAGSHTISARYRGDTNFLASSSSSSLVSVSAMPDFSVALGPASQSVQGGSLAVYTVSVSAAGGAFTGVVSLSVAGLPPGAVASFTPASVIPGASISVATLSVQTVARSGALRGRLGTPLLAALGLGAAMCTLLFAFGTRSQRISLLSLIVLVLPLAGCGTRTSGSSVSQGQAYTLTIIGTGTNLAGATVSHSAPVTLTVY